MHRPLPLIFITLLMALPLAAQQVKASGTTGITIPSPAESNVVFATLTDEAKTRARSRFSFYDWPDDGSPLVRLMCSFDTTLDDVDELVRLIAG